MKTEQKNQKNYLGVAAPPSMTANRRVGAVSDHPHHRESAGFWVGMKNTIVFLHREREQRT
jgi:hypothetical protein